MIKNISIASLIVLCLILIPGLRADAASFTAFLGDYVGETTFEVNGVQWKRNLNVAIKSKGKGFSVEWMTTTFKASGKVTKKTYSVDFVPSDREGIYSSAMKTNVFGGRVALDPLKGDPYVWARINGDTLTIFALLITESGGYEMQVYDRTLTPDGLDLKFSRLRYDKTSSTIEAKLTRLDE